MRACDLIRKSRKTLLTELSGLVKAAKKLSHSSIEYADEITDELILRTFKIVLRGVRFLDVWYEQYEITGNFIDSYRDEYVDVEVGVTVLSAPQSASVRSSVSASLHSQCSESETGGYFGMSGRNQSIRELANRSHPLPSTPVIQTPRLSNELRCRHVVVETLEIQTEAPSSVFALARLNTTQDALLSYLGSYIGRIHQPQARFTPQLQLTQQQSVAAARDLVAVVEAVLVRDPRPNPRLEKAKDSMYIHINTLIAAAYEAITNRTEGMDEEEEGVLILDSGRSLVEAATGCVRGAGDCVGKSKIVIEKIGDFELETRALNIGLGITTDSAQPIAVEEQSQVSTANPEEPETQVEGPESLQAVIDRQKMPPPPAPERAPLPIQPKNRSASIPLSVDTNLLPATSVVPPTPARILETPEVASRRSSVTSLLQPIANSSPSLVQGAFDQKKDSEAKLLFNKSVRADSFGAESISATSADSIGANSLRGSEFSMLSQTSTRATTPEPNSATSTCTPLLNTDLTLSQTSLVSATGSICEMHGDDLTFNKDGQITGGTLAALVEKLTVHDSTPDAVFVATFYLTFRLFATPKEFAEALVKRFESVSEASGAMPVRLRVYNVFKGWMESHWRQSQDYDALEVIRVFGETILSAALPAAAKRLLDLAEKVSDMDGPLVPRFVCSMGKTASSSATYSLPETPIPSPAISRSQINALKNSLAPGGMSVSILDFEPMELARQFTLKESRMFCSIRPEELIAQEWTKKKDSLAVNVLGMSSLSTDLAHLVAETILDVQDIKKRAVVIKQWIKIADRCLELNNYDSLMAIMCTMNTSTIGRLKKTWELVSFKTKQALDNLRAVIDVSKNHAVLRARLRGHVPPCLPFLGTYLTDVSIFRRYSSTKC